MKQLFFIQTVYSLKKQAFLFSAKTGCIVAICLLMSIASFSQDNSLQSKDATYIKTITQRANKIVAVLGITDSSKFYRVQDIIVQQYSSLNTLHDTYNAKAKSIKKDSTIEKKLAAEQIAKVEEERNGLLDELHKKYLSRLSAELNEEQIVKVKDGMTYNVLPITYKGYQEMLPTLTTEQKSKMYDYLVEAREHAMDAESSEKKHAWFGKYKGKINNYLSAAGIDMKKAGQEWEERIKKAKENKPKA